MIAARENLKKEFIETLKAYESPEEDWSYESPEVCPQMIYDYKSVLLLIHTSKICLSASKIAASYSLSNFFTTDCIS